MPPMFGDIRRDPDGNSSRVWEDDELGVRGYIRTLSLPGVSVECLAEDYELYRHIPKAPLEALLDVRSLERARVLVEETLEDFREEDHSDF